jgi:hypothetical protein
MRNGSPARALATAILALAVVAPGCGRPPDEAWLRFLGFKSGDSTLTVREGDLNDGKTDSADAAFSNTSVIVGASDSGAGTGILVKSARVDYKLSGHSPPSEDYPLNLYLPSSHSNGTATTANATEGQTSFPLATASLKRWLIDAHAAGSSPTLRLTANVTFFAETDEGTELEVHGSISILLSSSASDGTSGQTVTVAATTATATATTPGKFTITRAGDTDVSLTVEYDVGGTAVAGTDFQDNLGTSAVIASGASSKTVTVTRLSGATAGRTVILTLSSTSDYTGGSTATVTIAD